MTGFSFRPVLQGLGRAAGLPAVALAVWVMAGSAAAQEGTSTLPAPTQGVFDAVMKNDMTAVQRGVGAGADVTLRNTRGLTPAEFAVEIGNIEIANYLLAQERIQLRAQQEAKDRARAAKSAPKAPPKAAAPSAKKTEPSRAVKDGGVPPDEPVAARPSPAPAPAPDIVQPKRSRNFFQWLAGVMVKDDEPPPAKAPEKPEETKPPVKAEEAKPPQEQKPEQKSKQAAAPSAAKGRKAAEPLPPPDQPPRSRNFFEWFADKMAGRDARVARRPRMPEGLREPPETAEAPPPVLSARDPWAAAVTPTMPPIAAKPEETAPKPADSSRPSETAEARPDSTEKPTAAPVPGETAPGSWSPTVEHGGTTPAPESQIAAVPDKPGAPEDRKLLFSRPGAPPKPAGKAADTKKDAGGGLFGAVEEKKDGDKDTGQTGGLWGSKVEMAQSRPMVTAPPAAPPVPENVPVGLGFMVGRSLSLDKDNPPRGSEDVTGRGCVEKARGQVLFCVEAANWPKAMETDFTVNTILYTGQQAVVRYDAGKATRIQTLFPSESFDRVASYYSGLYGPPAENWTRSIAPLAAARRDNPTRAWRARNPKTGAIATLEIRKFDDTRGGFPDIKRGVVMLYYHEAAPIFPQVSALELMRLKRPPLGNPEKRGG